jgi:hypothetical protein
VGGAVGVTSYPFSRAEYLILACENEEQTCQVCGDSADLVVTAPQVRTIYCCFWHWQIVRWVLEARRYRVSYSPAANVALGMSRTRATP